jgi:hypothetical protein
MVSLFNDPVEESAAERSPSRHRPPPVWPLWIFRVVVTAEAVFAFNQAIFAGRFIAGDFGAVATHALNATVTGVTLLVEAVAGLLLWRPGRGPLWPAGAALLLFGLVGLQITIGYSRVLIVHVPLGVTIIVLDFFMLVWSWRRRRTQDPSR